MTRKIDRVHELRRPTEPVFRSERQKGVDAVAGADLRELLGIPVGMDLVFGGSVTGEQPGVKTWTYEAPDSPEPGAEVE